MEMVGEKSFIRYILDYMPDLLEDWVRIEDDEIVGDYAEYFKQAIRLEGTIVDKGKHACAVIISNDPLRTRCPIARDKHDLDIVEFEGEDTEAAGLLKLDVLGLRSLDRLMLTNDLLRKRNWKSSTSISKC
jgi:DNA polymerase III alpha subunit